MALKGAAQKFTQIYLQLSSLTKCFKCTLEDFQWEEDSLEEI